jgi:hypothetical protein
LDLRVDLDDAHEVGEVSLVEAADGEFELAQIGYLADVTADGYFY